MRKRRHNLILFLLVLSFSFSSSVASAWDEESPVGAAIRRAWSDIPPDTNKSDNQPARPLPRKNVPNQIVLDKTGLKTSGTLTELIPGSGVYVTARHVLQGHSDTFGIAAAFLSAHVNIKDYAFIEFQGDRNRRLDLIVAVPRASLSKWFYTDSRDCNCNPTDPLYSFSIRTDLQLYVDIDDPFYSYGHGTIGKDDVLQVSTGNITQRANGRVFIEKQDNSHFTPRSSGSVIYTVKEDQNHWRPAGIVECITPQKTQKNGLSLPGATRVIPFWVLYERKGWEIPLSKLIAEPVANDEPDCIKVGGGDGGN